MEMIEQCICGVGELQETTITTSIPDGTEIVYDCYECSNCGETYCTPEQMAIKLHEIKTKRKLRGRVRVSKRGK